MRNRTIQNSMRIVRERVQLRFALECLIYTESCYALREILVLTLFSVKKLHTVNIDNYGKLTGFFFWGGGWTNSMKGAVAQCERSVNELARCM
jgi:hypothetical protein